MKEDRKLPGMNSNTDQCKEFCAPLEEICSNLCLISSSQFFADLVTGTFPPASPTLSQISRPSGLLEDTLTRRTRRSDWQ